MDLEKLAENNDVYGFTSKAGPRASSVEINIPESTRKSMNLAKNELLEICLRKPSGETQFLSRKVEKSNSNYKFYVPVKVSEDLGLAPGDLVDVFITRK